MQCARIIVSVYHLAEFIYKPKFKAQRSSGVLQYSYSVPCALGQEIFLRPQSAKIAG